MQWSRPAVELARQVRAYNPWPVAETRLGDERLRIWQAHAIAGESGEPGRIVATSADGLDVATGAGHLRITELQRPGGRRVSAAQFLQARLEMSGQRLGA